MRHPIAVMGRVVVGLAGQRFRPFWSGSLVHDDGSPLYSGIQRKKYRDVGWSMVHLTLCLLPLSVMIQALVYGPGFVEVDSPLSALFCMAIIPISLLSFKHVLSDLRDSQLVHAAREEGVTDDLFYHEEEDEPELEDDDEEELPDPAGDNVVNFPGDDEQSDEPEEESFWA